MAGLAVALAAVALLLALPLTVWVCRLLAMMGLLQIKPELLVEVAVPVRPVTLLRLRVQLGPVGTGQQTRLPARL